MFGPNKQSSGSVSELGNTIIKHLSGLTYRYPGVKCHPYCNTIKSGVPQGSVLGPLLYILFTSDLPQAPNVTIGTLADDTAILISHTNVVRASTTLQEYLHIFNRWLQKSKIKVNETKSSYLTFTLRNDPSPPIYLNEV